MKEVTCSQLHGHVEDNHADDAGGRWHLIKLVQEYIDLKMQRTRIENCKGLYVSLNLKVYSTLQGNLFIHVQKKHLLHFCSYTFQGNGG